MSSRNLRTRRADAGIAPRELNQFCEKLSVADSVRDEAARVCTKGLRRGLVKGRSLIKIAASSLYAACREYDVPATLDDVAAASGLHRDDIARCYRLLVTELNLKIPLANPAEYVERVASRANASPKVEAETRAMISRAAKAGITDGVNPLALAASALYLASILEGESLTQGSAAQAAGVTEATVRKQCKRLRKVLGVQLGRTPRKNSLRLSEIEASQSAGLEMTVRSPTR